MTKVLTRRELFDLVWQKPARDVAQELGISDVALTKICQRHRVPKPSRGYWAKKAAGKPVRKALFREVSDPDVDRIIIRGSSKRAMPERIEKAAARARKRERLAGNRVEVDSNPQELHATIAKTVARLRKAKPDDRNLLQASGANVFDAEVSSAGIDRLAALLNALVWSAEGRGYQIELGENALVLIVEGERNDLRISELLKKRKHEPTQKELAAIARWEKQQTLQYSGWTPRPAVPEWDYEPSGHLRLTLNENLYSRDGLRRTFSDGKRQRLENLVNTILEALAIWAAAIRETRAEKERDEREREARRRRDEEIRRLKALEKKRIDALSENVDRWHRHTQLKAYIAAVHEKLDTGGFADPDGVQKWLDWAEEYANQVDPLTNSAPRLLQVEDFRPWELHN